MNKDKVINWSILRIRVSKIFKAIKWPVAAVLITFSLTKFDWRLLSDLRVDSVLILEYVSVLRWPLVVLLILFLLKPYIPDLIERVREFGIGNSKVRLSGPSVNQGRTAARDLKGGEEVADETIESEESDEDAKLEKVLTSTEANIAYEQTYRQIYGTQLEVLRRLSSYTNGLNSDDLEDIFEEHKKKGDHYAYTNFMSFMQFLLDNILATYDPKDRTYKLTYAGLYFIRYLEGQNLLGAYKAL